MVAKKPNKKIEAATESGRSKAEALGGDKKPNQGKHQPASMTLFQAKETRMLNKAITRLALANQSALVEMEPGLKPWFPKARLSNCTRSLMRRAPEGQEAAKELEQESEKGKKGGGDGGDEIEG